MSSPIHHAKDLDAALMYAPPWVREGREAPSRSAPPVDWPQRSVRLENICAFSGDRAVLEVQRQLALDPDRVPEPPPPFASDRSIGRIAMRTCGAVGIAAAVAWIVVSVPGAERLQQETAHAGFSVPPILNKQGGLQAATPAQVSVQNERAKANEPPPPPRIVLGVNPAKAQPVVAVQSTPALSDGNTLRLDNEEIAALIKRGQNFLTNGDVAAARLLLLRAAEAGSATAALVLGTTFDPLVIQRLGAVGREPDAARARKWYQKAMELGSEVASQQLAKLAQVRQ
jgi:hypothetical protein